MEIKDAEVEAICVAMFGANDREIELALTRSLKEAAHKGLPS